MVGEEEESCNAKKRKVLVESVPKSEEDQTTTTEMFD
jgi:hypothetical protein